VTDVWNKVVEKLHLPRFLDYARYTVLSVLLVFTMTGCQFLYKPKAPDPLDPKVLITREFLDARVIEFEAKARASYKVIEVQENMIQQMTAGLTQLIATVPGPWGVVLTSILGISAVGLGVTTVGVKADNSRKNRVIKDLKDVVGGGVGTIHKSRSIKAVKDR